MIPPVPDPTGARPLAIVTALGSRGDVNPMLAIAAALRAGGFDTLVILAERYQRLTESMGLASEIAVTTDQLDRQLADPRLWRPILGARMLITEWIPDLMPRLYRIIERHYRPGRTVLVAHPLDLASRVFRDAHPRAALVTVHLAPLALRDAHDPAHLTTGLLNVRRPVPLVRLAYWFVDAILVRRWLEPALNQFRGSLGLPAVSRPLDQWWYSPDRVIGLFPSWFAPAHLPPEFHCHGFPLFDGPEASDTEAVERALAPYEKPPVVFTAGSAHATADAFFRSSAEAARRLEMPALLLSGHREQVPRELPRHVHTAAYVPLGNLLPRCKAIVHHGGIGTTSQALAAGIPQLVCPMAFDQFDNAARVVRIGCGRTLPMKQVSAESMATELRTLLEVTKYAESARERRALIEPGPTSVDHVAADIRSLLASLTPDSILLKKGVSDNR